MDNNDNVFDTVLDSVTVLNEKNNEWKQFVEDNEGLLLDLEESIVSLKYEYETVVKELLDCKSLCEQLIVENEKMVNGIVDTYNGEKTMMGKSVLRKLMGQLDWEIKWE